MSLRGMMVVDLYRMNARQNVYSYAYTRKLNALVHALLKMDLKRRRRRQHQRHRQRPSSCKGGQRSEFCTSRIELDYLDEGRRRAGAEVPNEPQQPHDLTVHHRATAATY